MNGQNNNNFPYGGGAFPYGGNGGGYPGAPNGGFMGSPNGGPPQQQQQQQQQMNPAMMNGMMHNQFPGNGGMNYGFHGGANGQPNGNPAGGNGNGFVAGTPAGGNGNGFAAGTPAGGNGNGFAAGTPAGGNGNGFGNATPAGGFAAGAPAGNPVGGTGNGFAAGTPAGGNGNDLVKTEKTTNKPDDGPSYDELIARYLSKNPSHSGKFPGKDALLRNYYRADQVDLTNDDGKDKDDFDEDDSKTTKTWAGFDRFDVDEVIKVGKVCHLEKCMPQTKEGFMSNKTVLESFVEYQVDVIEHRRRGGSDSDLKKIESLFLSKVGIQEPLNKAFPSSGRDSENKQKTGRPSNETHMFSAAPYSVRKQAYKHILTEEEKKILFPTSHGSYNINYEAAMKKKTPKNVKTSPAKNDKKNKKKKNNHRRSP